MNSTIKLVIADDHPVVRDGIRNILSPVPHIVLVGEAGSGAELVHICSKLEPDVVLTDVVMNGDLDGEQATRIIAEKYPSVKVIAMSMHERYYDICRMLEAGAVGYISKNAEKEEYIQAIEKAADFRSFYCSRIRKRLHDAGPNFMKLYNKIQFTEKELATLRLLWKGYSNAEVAAELELSIRTIEGYRLDMLEKLDTKRILTVFNYAICAGLIRIDDDITE